MSRTSFIDAKGSPDYALAVEASRFFQKGDLLRSLRFLDRLNGGKAQRPRPYTRALVRELAGDLTGSLDDLRRVADASPDQEIAKARVLSKLGFVDEAGVQIREMLSASSPIERQGRTLASLGVGGRRFDLELLALSEESKQASFEREWQVGCSIEHLMALGEFDECRRLARSLAVTDYDLLSLIDVVKSRDGFSRTQRLSMAEVERTIEGVRGWFSLDEAAVLSNLAAEVPRHQQIVEVGSFAGRSTCALALGAEAGLRPEVHAVDPHSGLRGILEGGTLALFNQNLRSRGLEGRVTTHATTSANAANKWKGRSIGLLFIDADHAYRSVRSDYRAWLPHLAAHGFVAFHDSNQPGPARLLQEILDGPSELKPVGLRDSLFVMQRTGGRHIQSRRQQSPWQEYLAVLSRHYSSWVRSERRRLARLASDALDSLTRSGRRKQD